MAKKIFLSDIDLALNQLLQAKLENLASDPTGTESRIYYNTVIKKVKYYNGTAWLTVVDDLDSRLTDSRTPTAHVIATNVALGSEHTISGAAVGHVLRASGATTANFQQLAHSDISGIGSNTHAQIDTHIGDATKHRVINDAGTSNTDLFSASKILQLIADLNTTIAGSLVYKGGYDAATNTPLLDATPIAVTQGWTYVVTVAGTFFTEAVQVGDMIIAKQTNPTALTHWTVVNKNIPDIVAASETVSGIIEIATQAEVTTGTDDIKAITPLKLAQAVPSASETLAGKIEIATTAEATAGTDNVRAITPLKLAQAVPAASETVAGRMEIATTAEVATGTDDTRAITPLKLKTALGITATLSTARKFTAVIPGQNGVLTSFDIDHGIPGMVVAQVFRTATPFDYVDTEIIIGVAGHLTVNFNVAPTASAYSIVVVG